MDAGSAIGEGGAFVKDKWCGVRAFYEGLFKGVFGLPLMKELLFPRGEVQSPEALPHGWAKVQKERGPSEIPDT